MNPQPKTGPVDVIRDGALKATIWENEGENGVYFSTVLARTYEDTDGRLRDTHSFTGSDLLRVAELARRAYEHVSEYRAALNHQHKADPDESLRDEYQHAM
ncbi:MAG: hypothetical protein KDI65_10595 [Alphaproteobacteria bacterium]|nr:hypothetical protein [Alphaproteobacteria bacterium]